MRNKEGQAVRETNRVRRARERRSIHGQIPKLALSVEGASFVNDRSDKPPTTLPTVEPFEEIEDL